MKNLNTARALRLTALAASLAAAFGATAAEDNEIARLSRPESSVQLGIGYLTEDAARFGQYTGLRNEGIYAIGNVDYVTRDDASGTWLRFGGRNLGLDSRELRFEQERQGNWKYFLEYNQIPRFSQYEVNTGLDGAGHDAVRVNGAPFRDKRLRTEREVVTAGGQKYLGGGWNVRVSFKNDVKEGSRLFGRGTPSVQEFLAEPIDHTMRQAEAVVGYADQKLQLSGGYYGSFFKNENPALFVSGGAAPLASFTPIGLPPDNHAHQLYLTGGYSFTPMTRGNFKLARTIATQDEDFVVPPAAAIGRTNLGGRVETTLAQLGLSARPLPKLSLLANATYEDRDDDTKKRPYFTPSSTFSGTNEPRSLRKTTGKVEASYALPADFRITGGLDYDARERNVFPARLVSFREETEESGYRVELRRAMSETINGSVAYVHSERNGSNFDLAGSLAVFRPVAPVHLADRERDKVRLKFDWAPIEPLSLQILADFADDDYDDDRYGLREGESQFWSLDASYNFTDDWQGLAWVSRDNTGSVNNTRTGTNDWAAKLRVVSEAFGLGLRGKLGSGLKVGGDLLYSHDRSSFREAGTTAALTSLPQVKYTLATVKLFAEYAMRKDTDLRLDLIHDRWSTNDWAWSTYRYTDGTTLSQDKNQETSFVGVSMRYHWH